MSIFLSILKQMHFCSSHDNYIYLMRHQILKQKQSIAHKTIQPIAKLMTTQIQKDHKSQTIVPIFHLDTRDGYKNQREDENTTHKNANRSKLESTGTIFHRAFREKQWIVPSLDYRGSNKSQKLVGNQQIITLENTDRTLKTQQKQEEDVGRLYKQDEHIHKLMKVNQNLRSLQGKNSGMLLKSIELLRNNEKHYLPSIQTLPESASIRKDQQLLLLQTLEPCEQNDPNETDSQADGRNIDERNINILRTIKQQAAQKFKEKIKVKQSRRHIYRTLKNKNDVLNKIKLKTHHCTPNKDRSNPQIRQMEELQLIRVHCPEGRKDASNVRSSNFRSLTKTYYQNMRDLRIQTIQASVQDKPSFQLRTTKCQFLSNDIESLTNHHKKKSGFQAYEQIAKKLKRNHETSPKQKKELSNKNVFRELTPWHFEDQ